MAYRELLNVAAGCEGQLEAIINALDNHENPPQEIEDLTNLLESAIQICKTITSKGNDEPEEAPADQPASAADPQTVAAPTASADTTAQAPNIFESDPEDPRAEA
jgi:hypothetical protein